MTSFTAAFDDSLRAQPAGTTSDPAAAAPSVEASPVVLLSPFVPWREDERGTLPVDLAAGEIGRSLFYDLLYSPAAAVDRLLRPERRRSAVIGALAIVALGSAFSSVVVVSAWAGYDVALQAALGVPAATLGCVAAVLGPLYATGILYGVRLPLSLLVGSLLASMATGILLLSALSPLPYILWRVDDHWGGPLAVVAVFAIAGAASGVRLRRLLNELAVEITRRALDDPAALLSAKAKARVDVLARVALLLVTAALAIAGWAWLGDV